MTTSLDEFYETPIQVTRAILPALSKLSGERPGDADRPEYNSKPPRWIEPCAGKGAIVRAVNAYRHGAALPTLTWTLVDPVRHQELADYPAFVRYEDFCQLSTELARQQYDVLITNPPFSIALDIVKAAVEDEVARIMAFLLPLHFLASAKRYEFISKHTPSIYVFPQRPSFIGEHARTIPRAEYMWAVWEQDPHVQAFKPTVEILPGSSSRRTRKYR